MMAHHPSQPEANKTMITQFFFFLSFFCSLSMGVFSSPHDQNAYSSVSCPVLPQSSLQDVALSALTTRGSSGAPPPSLTTLPDPEKKQYSLYYENPLWTPPSAPIPSNNASNQAVH